MGRHCLLYSANYYSGQAAALQVIAVCFFVFSSKAGCLFPGPFLPLPQGCPLSREGFFRMPNELADELEQVLNRIYTVQGSAICERIRRWRCLLATQITTIHVCSLCLFRKQRPILLTEHYLHVQEPIRQAVVERFSDAFGTDRTKSGQELSSN